MRKSSLFILVLALAIPGLVSAQEISSAEPFKVGTFEIDEVAHVAIVLRDSLVVEIEAANAALERSPVYPHVPPPGDVIELIERHDYGVKRLYEIVNELVANDQLGANRPDYIHRVDDIRTLPPILYPGKILNAAVNFYSHVNETGNDATIAVLRTGS
jgi:hypothetical protein